MMPQKTSLKNVIRIEKELIFNLNDDFYGIEMTHIQEVIQNIQKIIHIPHTPDYIEGLIAFHDIFIPLINLKKYFNLTGDYSSHNVGIVLNSNEKLYGIRVDNIHEIIDMTANSLAPMHDTQHLIPMAFIRGIGKFDQSNFIALDLEHILSVESQKHPHIHPDMRYENE